MQPMNKERTEEFELDEETDRVIDELESQFDEWKNNLEKRIFVPGKRNRNRIITGIGGSRKSKKKKKKMQFNVVKLDPHRRIYGGKRFTPKIMIRNQRKDSIKIDLNVNDHQQNVLSILKFSPKKKKKNNNNKIILNKPVVKAVRFANSKQDTLRIYFPAVYDDGMKFVENGCVFGQTETLIFYQKGSNAQKKVRIESKCHSSETYVPYVQKADVIFRKNNINAFGVGDTVCSCKRGKHCVHVCASLFRYLYKKENSLKLENNENHVGELLFQRSKELMRLKSEHLSFLDDYKVKRRERVIVQDERKTMEKEMENEMEECEENRSPSYIEDENQTSPEKRILLNPKKRRRSQDQELNLEFQNKRVFKRKREEEGSREILPHFEEIKRSNTVNEFQ